jgi:hypothetical protein
LISANDTFLAPGLTPQQIADLRKVFSAEAEISSAAVVQKQLTHFPANPCFVVALTIEVLMWKLRVRGSDKQLVTWLLKQVHLPGHFMIFVSEKNLKALGTKVIQTPGAFVYRRGE